MKAPKLTDLLDPNIEASNFPILTAYDVVLDGLPRVRLDHASFLYVVRNIHGSTIREFTSYANVTYYHITSHEVFFYTRRNMDLYKCSECGGMLKVEIRTRIQPEYELVCLRCGARHKYGKEEVAALWVSLNT